MVAVQSGVDDLLLNCLEAITRCTLSRVLPASKTLSIQASYSQPSESDPPSRRATQLHY